MNKKEHLNKTLTVPGPARAVSGNTALEDAATRGHDDLQPGETVGEKLRRVFDLEPWLVLDSGLPMCLDLPFQGVNQGCFCITGNGENEPRGFILFASLLDYRAYRRARGGPEAWSSYVALEFAEPGQRSGELLANVIAMDRGEPIDVRQVELELVEALAEVVAIFAGPDRAGPPFEKLIRKARLMRKRADGLCAMEGFFLQDGSFASMVIPFIPRLQHREGGPLVGPARSQKVPRNASCPCGSLKKYKKCCLLRVN